MTFRARNISSLVPASRRDFSDLWPNLSSKSETHLLNLRNYYGIGLGLLLRVKRIKVTLILKIKRIE